MDRASDNPLSGLPSAGSPSSVMPTAAPRAAASAFSAAPATVDANTPALRWVSDSEPGMRRIRRGRGFVYLDADGRQVRDARVLQRIRALAIPPAYREVWICDDGDGHLQATGRDARGRKQYLYHPLWRAQREGTKFEHLHAFGRALPRIRRAVRRQLEGFGVPMRERVLAALVRLLDTTWLRVGNEEYLRTNGSFGLSTLRKRHVHPSGSEIRLSFVGKSGVRQQASLDDPRVARVLRRCQALPGQELFRSVEADGTVQSIGSTDVNAWLRQVARAQLSAKDFRTWHATVLALDLALDACRARSCRGEGAPTPALDGPAIVAAVARRLGNTAAVCRKSYIHPLVIGRFDALADAAGRERMAACAWALAPRATRGLRVAERRLLALLGTADGRACRRRPNAKAAPR